MKIIFLNEGAFGSYKNKKGNKTQQEKLDDVQKQALKIVKNVCRNEIGVFYGKVLQEFAKEAPKALKKFCASFINNYRSLNFDVARIFDINESIYSYSKNNTQYELSDYENIAKSLYFTKECVDCDHTSLVIPMEMGYDNGFIEESILRKNVLYKSLVKAFKSCIDKAEISETIPDPFKKPTEFKILLLNSHTKSSWGYHNNEIPPIETLYDSIFKGTYKGSLYEIVETGVYHKNGKNDDSKFIRFATNNEDVTGKSYSNITLHSGKDIQEIIKVYSEIIYNSRYWDSLDIVTSFNNNSNKEFIDFINTCTKEGLNIRYITFEDPDKDASILDSGNKSLNVGVDRALKITKIIDNLKTSCQGLNNTQLNFPKNLAGGGFTIKADKKFLAAKPILNTPTTNKHTAFNFTSLGKNIGIGVPAGKFVRNIYAIDVKSPSLKKDLMKMIKIASANDKETIDLSGKYETHIIEKVAEHMITTFTKLLTLRPHCCSGDYLLLCSYTQEDIHNLDDVIRIGFAELKEVKKKLTVQATYDFKLACAQGFNPNYSAVARSMQNSGKSYEYIAGKKVRIEIPV